VCIAAIVLLLLPEPNVTKTAGALAALAAVLGFAALLLFLKFESDSGPTA
jgi:hypothetical protein